MNRQARSSASARWSLGVLLAFAACQSPSGGAPAAAPPGSRAAPSATPALSVVAPAPSTAAPVASAAAVPSGLALGPAAPGTPIVEREAAVTRLMHGESASELPERAVDADATFEPDGEARVQWRLHPDVGRRAGPRLRMADFTAGAGLPAEIVERILRQNNSNVRACYEHELVSKPKLEGKFRLAFVITPEGEIKSPRLDALTLNDAPLFTCVTKSLTEVIFPQPDGGASVTVSATFLLVP